MSAFPEISLALPTPLLAPPAPAAPPAGSAFDEAVGAMVIDTVTLPAGSAVGEDLDRMFKHDPELDCAVVVDGGRPTHLVTREHFYIKTGGPYGFTLYQKRPAESVAKADPLVVDETVTVTRLAQLALSRARDSQYDPVIVTGPAGGVRGIVTIRQLIQRAAELEVQSARLSNPLTRLPGPPMIQTWIEEGIAADRDGSLTVLFTDLDNFKQYNDVYGLTAGDEMVRRTALVLTAGLPLLGPEARLGHAGGDDFVVVSPRPVETDALREVCARFDRERLTLFKPADLGRGFFYARDDKGNLHKMPLLTLSLTVITSRALADERHPAIFSQVAASLRRTAKTLTTALGRSAFVVNDWRTEGAVA
jgi:GGDEF domain-containing protein